MKTYDYKICIVDTEDTVTFLDILKIYGLEGWRFVGWAERKNGNLRGAILEKESE